MKRRAVRQAVGVAGLGGLILLAGCIRESGPVEPRAPAMERRSVPRVEAERPPEAVARGPRPLRGTFVVPAGLEAEVRFWRDIFAKYSRRQIVFHDTDDLSRIYSVIDLRPLEAEGLSDAAIEQRASLAVKKEKERIRGILRRLHHRDGVARNDEERRIQALFPPGDTTVILAASDRDRIRAQSGIRERFARGIEIGHGYFPVMEAIFRREGVPVEITRLPLIESSFNLKAYSHAGAAGVWQFIPSTARLYMRVDRLIDERRDPIVSAQAAARFLRHSYEKLGSWPLAITSYNHGPGGVARAVRETGTSDIVEIIRRYDGPRFRFASRNFYLEFLAALEVEQNHEHYFGPLRLERPRAAERIRLPDYVYIDSVARCAGVSRDDVAELNPSFSRSIVSGKYRIPRGHEVWIPASRGEEFTRRYAGLSADHKFDRQRRMYVVHRVRRGQTLAGIARRYGTSVTRIQRYNKIRNRNLIRVGMRLRIPTS